MGETLNPVIDGKQRAFCCHSATLSGRFPPNSLPAVDECVSAAVPRLEIDVRFLADDSMLIFHDGMLDKETSASGRVDQFDRAAASAIRFRRDPSVPLCFIEDVVDRMKGSSTLLQVDLKLIRPISTARAQRLAAALDPLDGHLIVGSQAHWNLRPLAALGLPIALDPTLHWHAEFPNEHPGGMPASLGLFGLRDDAPIARLPAATADEYVATRIDDLLALLPEAREWMVDYGTLLRLSALGSPLGELLARRGVSLAAWTILDRGPEATTPLLSDLFGLGATTIITDSATQLAAYSSGLCRSLARSATEPRLRYQGSTKPPSHRYPCQSGYLVFWSPRLES